MSTVDLTVEAAVDVLERATDEGTTTNVQFDGLSLKAALERQKIVDGLPHTD